MSQKPSVGRIVHFHAQNPNGSEPITCAAIIARVIPSEDKREDYVNLTVIDPGGQTFAVSGVVESKEPKENHWSWPPKV